MAVKVPKPTKRARSLPNRMLPALYPTMRRADRHRSYRPGMILPFPTPEQPLYEFYPALGLRFCEIYNVCRNTLKGRYAIVPGKVVHADLRGTDIFAVKNGKASITPLQTWPHGHPFGLLDSEMAAALCRKSLLGKHQGTEPLFSSPPPLFFSLSLSPPLSARCCCMLLE